MSADETPRCADCGRDAAGDFPGLGLKCNDCRLAIRRAASKMAPVVGRVKEEER